MQGPKKLALVALQIRLFRNESAMLASSIPGRNWKRNDKQWQYKINKKQNDILCTFQLCKCLFVSLFAFY